MQLMTRYNFSPPTFTPYVSNYQVIAIIDYKLRGRESFKCIPHQKNNKKKKKKSKYTIP